MGSKKLLIYGVGGILLTWGLSLVVSKLLVPDWNPPKRHTGVILNEEADRILKQSCFDCHSNETKKYWYSNLPVVSVIIAFHIYEGRKELNFSDWDNRPESKKRKSIRKSLDTITEGEMPLAPYTLVHPEAKMNNQKIETVKQAASSELGLELENDDK